MHTRVDGDATEGAMAKATHLAPVLCVSLFVDSQSVERLAASGHDHTHHWPALPSVEQQEAVSSTRENQLRFELPHLHWYIHVLPVVLTTVNIDFFLNLYVDRTCSCAL